MLPKFKITQFKKLFLNNITTVNILTVGMLTLFVSGFGFVKEIIIADNFGLSELLDTFLIAILAPSIIYHIFLGSFNSVFIPNYVRSLKINNLSIGRFQSTSFLISIGVSLLFFILSLIFTDIFLEVFYKNHSEQYYDLIKKQFYCVAPCILFWGLSSIINGLLTIDNEFRYSTISAVFTPISIILLLIFFKEALGDLVLAIGTLSGSILGFIFVSIVAFKRNLIHLQKPDFVSSDIKLLFKQLPAKLSSGLLVGINPFIDQYFSAQLIAGSIGALNYGLKIPAFAIGIVGIAVGNVMLPYFSKQAVEDIVGTFIKLQSMLKKLIIFSIIITVLLFLFSTTIISLFFERGAFTNSDTRIVSKIQQMYFLQIPSYITGLIMVKFLTSINKNNFMVITSIISLVLNISLNYILIKQLGVYGLAFATSVVSLVNSVILYIYIYQLNKQYV